MTEGGLVVETQNVDAFTHEAIEAIKRESSSSEATLKVDPVQRPVLKVRGWVWMAVLAALFANFYFAWDMSCLGGVLVMNPFREQMKWGDNPPSGQSQEAYVTTQEGALQWTFDIGVLVGIFPAGMLCDWIGRRYTLLAYMTLATVSSIMMTAAPGIGVLIAARVITGIAFGGYIVALSLYTTEVYPSKSRGLFYLMGGLSGGIGGLTINIANYWLSNVEWGWRFSFGGAMLGSVPLAIILWFYPETPRWLILKGRHEDAKKSMAMFRWPDEVESEMALVEEGMRKEREAHAKGTWMGLWTGPFKQAYRTNLTNTYMTLAMLGGYDTIAYFGPSMLSTFFGSNGSLIGGVIFSATAFVGGLPAFYTLDHIGRYALSLYGTICQTIACFWVVFLTIPYNPLSPAYLNNTTVQIFVVVAEAFYMLAFVNSTSPVLYVYQAEVHNTVYRGKAFTVGMLLDTLASFVIDFASPKMYQPQALGIWGTYLIFGCVNSLFVVFIRLCMPETKGIPLEDMDEMFEWYKWGWKREVYPGKEAYLAQKQLKLEEESDGLEKA